jgi:hypothetical protein
MTRSFVAVFRLGAGPNVDPGPSGVVRHLVTHETGRNELTGPVAC